jgi:hypothetical protein
MVDPMCVDNDGQEDDESSDEVMMVHLIARHVLAEVRNGPGEGTYTDRDHGWDRRSGRPRPCATNWVAKYTAQVIDFLCDGPEEGEDDDD